MTNHSIRMLGVAILTAMIGLGASGQASQVSSQGPSQSRSIKNRDAAEKTLEQRTLIKFKGNAADAKAYSWMTKKAGWTVSPVTDQLVVVKGISHETVQSRLGVIANLFGENEIEYTQPDYPIRLMHDYRIQDSLRRAAILKSEKALSIFAKPMPADNPPLPTDFSTGQGNDPDIKRQWGILDIQGPEAWRIHDDSKDIIVAVIDTGIDYTHEDLKPNLWINKKEIPNNGIDDDHNGYVDDIIGWDFSANDNKPFDLAVEPLKLITKGGNPGHGTHCAGNVGARGGNGLGISGVAPHVQIMGLRFISEQGAGTTSGAIGAIRYAVDNGAKVLSNSWGSEGEDPENKEENKALREAIAYAEAKGVIFVAAAGNGHRGVGYDNDKDPAPAYPASYTHDNIISVAAIDVNDNLGSFSNWGATSVDIGAPGLNVYSTTVGNNYSDKVVDMAAITVDWDGTSMACPHVAGAAALYWGAHPTKSWQEVKDAILKSATPIPALKGKVTTNGKLNVLDLLKQ